MSVVGVACAELGCVCVCAHEQVKGSRGGKICVYIVCVIILLGLGSVLYKMVRAD